jgi:hypothetical protein
MSVNLFVSMEPAHTLVCAAELSKRPLRKRPPPGLPPQAGEGEVGLRRVSPRLHVERSGSLACAQTGVRKQSVLGAQLQEPANHLLVSLPRSRGRAGASAASCPCSRRLGTQVPA